MVRRRPQRHRTIMTMGVCVVCEGPSTIPPPPPILLSSSRGKAPSLFSYYNQPWRFWG